MKKIAGCLLLLVMLPVHAMSAGEAQHLLLRTGFGATDAQLQALQAQPYDAAVDHLVTEAAHHTQADTPAPAWANEPMLRYRKPKDASPEEKRAVTFERVSEDIDLQGWWMHEMINTPTPLAEQMTLFWHNHFTSGYLKVKAPTLMYRQNLTLRRYALGNFRDLLHAIARDPAMIRYLDNQTNRDQHPNENFARELMELFTLGIGNYSEDDVKEGARAFTGWMIRPDTGEFFEAPREHDGGEKLFLGHRGNLDGDDVIDIILAQPATATFIVEKMWRAFVSATPDPAQVQKLAAQFRSDYQIAPLVAALLKTPQFQAQSDYGTLTKSPVDLVVGTMRSFGVKVDDGRFPAIVSAHIGQELFNPPNVKGWPGGDSWINSQTLILRDQFLDTLSRGFNTNNYRQMQAMQSPATPAPAMATPAATAPTAQQMAEKADMDKTTMAGDSSNANGSTVANEPGKGPRALIYAQIMRSAQGLDFERYLGSFSEKHTLPQAEAVLLAIPPVDPPKADADPAEQLRTLLLDPAYQLK